MTRPPLRVPAFVVVGGGRDGVAYVTRLLRAAAAGALETGRIDVVDRDARCAAAGIRDSRVRLEVAPWSDWLEARLGSLDPRVHLVPHHWAPHLLLEWLERRSVAAGASTRRFQAPAPRGIPFLRETGAGDRALSYATWACPPSCIEPGLCPHTRGPKDWSLAGDLEGAALDRAAASPAEPGAPPVDGRLVFRALHLVWGVATVPVAALHEACGRVLAEASGTRRYLVATSSHCHALAAGLELDWDRV